MSLVNSQKKTPVKILRDSGALDTLIGESVLSFSPKSDTGKAVVIRGMGLKMLSAQLHRVQLVSDLFQGEVCVGELHQLPVDGVDITIGNDAASDRVWADGKTQNLISQQPSVLQESEKWEAVCFPFVLIPVQWIMRKARKRLRNFISL